MKISQYGRTRLAGAIAAGLGAGASSASAATVVTRVDANILEGAPAFDVDFNSDGVVEFDIQHFAAVTKVIEVLPSTGLIYADDNGANRVANLAIGSLVGPGETFILGPPPKDALNGIDGGPVGHFQVSDGPGFIGVQFDIGGNTHYGFVGYQGTGAEGDAAGNIYALGYNNSPGSAVEIPNLVPFNPADFDYSGKVDGDDFLIWQRGYDLTGQYSSANGDADRNTVVDNADLTVWAAAFGSAAQAAGGAVPEPTSLALLAAGAAGMTAYRRRAFDCQKPPAILPNDT